MVEAHPSSYMVEYKLKDSFILICQLTPSVSSLSCTFKGKYLSLSFHLSGNSTFSSSCIHLPNPTFYTHSCLVILCNRHPTLLSPLLFPYSPNPSPHYATKLATTPSSHPVRLLPPLPPGKGIDLIFLSW